MYTQTQLIQTTQFTAAVTPDMLTWQQLSAKFYSLHFFLLFIESQWAEEVSSNSKQGKNWWHLRMTAHSIQTKDATTRQVMAPASSLCINSGTNYWSNAKLHSWRSRVKCQKAIGLSLRTCGVYSGNQVFQYFAGSLYRLCCFVH